MWVSTLLSGAIWGYAKITPMWRHHWGDERSSVALICMSDISELCIWWLPDGWSFSRRLKVSSVVFICIPVPLSVSPLLLSGISNAPSECSVAPRDSNVCLLVRQSFHHFGPDWNISTTIAMKFAQTLAGRFLLIQIFQHLLDWHNVLFFSDIDGSHMTNPKHFGDLGGHRIFL